MGDTMITVEEFYSLRVFEVSNTIYNKIEAKFRKLFGDATKGFMQTQFELKLNTLSANSFVDIMDCFTII